METKEKIWKSLPIIIFVIASVIVLMQKLNTIIVWTYILLLFSVFILEKTNWKTVLTIAGLIPIAELLYVYIKHSSKGSSVVFTNAAENYSVFYQMDGFPGYILLCVIFPYAVYRLALIWGKN